MSGQRSRVSPVTLRSPGTAGTSEIPLVAVVDDDEPLREAIRNLLRSAGFRAMAFASAEDFLQTGQLQQTACLIVDVRMPRMSGLELQQQLTASRSAIPLIFVTSHVDEVTRARALRAGAVDFLYKPFSDEVLLRTVRSALQASPEGGDGGNR